MRDKFAEVSASAQSNIDFITLAGNLKKKYYDGKKITVNFLKKKSNKSSKLQCKSTKYKSTKSTKSTTVQKYKKCKDVKNVKSTKNTKVKNKIKTPAISIKKHYK